MNAVITMVARALVEHCTGRPEQEVPAACDAALQFLRRQGAPLAAMSALPPAVRRQLSVSQRIPALLATTNGAVGPARATILSALERTLGMTVELAEQASAGLIGGAVITVGDDRLDGSIRGALDRLEAKLRS